MALSLAGENLSVRWLLTAVAAIRPAAWFVGLHAGASGTAGATNEISVANGYARQPQTFTVTGNVATGVAALTFGPDTTAAWGTVTDFSLWDAATGGNCIWVGTVGSPVTYAVGDSATVAAAALTFSLS